MVLKKIDPFSCGKLLGALYGILGLLVGAFFSLFALAGVVAKQGGGMGPMEGLFAGAAIVLLPIFYGGMGFISGVIGAVLYNVMAGFVGGIEVEFEDRASLG